MIMSHPFPSTFCVQQPHRRSPAVDARHLVVDRPSQAPSNQINPFTIIPYPHPCLPTSSITQNRNGGGEPPRNLVGGRFFRHRPVRPLPPVQPPTAVSLLLPLARGPMAPFTRRSPASRPSGPPAHARTPTGPNPPWAQLTENSLFFLLYFSFPIYIYILIFYAPKIA
jgi:hypothetical protein